jgi:SAM-dependent methyltransferase
MNQQDKYASIKSLVLTIPCQLIGMSFTGLLAQTGIPLLMLFICHSLISGYFSIFLRLTLPWRFLNFMLPAGILVSQAFPGFGWVWGILLIVYGLLFLPTFWTRVPYFPSSHSVYDLIADQLPKSESFNFLDLGCGDGELLNFLSLKFPKAKFTGIDLSPTAIFAAKLKNKNNTNVRITFGDYWKLDFSEFDYIYAFLSPTPMPDLENKAQSEMKQNSTLLVNTFALPNWKAQRDIKIGDNNQTNLYVYTKI